VKYGDLAMYLDANGHALHNLASVQHITVAGACATATHGSGVKNGNLATAVTAVELVNANGEIVALTRKSNGDRFYGAVVGLGALGIVTRLTLEVQPRFSMRQLVYRNLPMAALENFAEIMSSGYSVSLFTDWSRRNINQVWIKTRVGDDNISTSEDFFGAGIATRHMHTMDEVSAETCTEQMGVSGSWCDRLPHFKREFNPASGRELQSEYFVPIERASEAMMALEELHGRITPFLFISEIRAVAADDLWMSPCYKRACASIHFTWKPDWNGVRGLLPLIEEKLAPFNAVPHWGKLFTISPRQLQSGYGRLDDFRQLVSGYDPDRKFGNDFLARYIYPA
jgi:xylitol oxidase